MLHLQGKGLADVGLPFGERLAGEAEHEVDADVGDAGGAQPLDGLAHLAGVVTAVEEAEPTVGECLGAHADAVDGQAGE